MATEAKYPVRTTEKTLRIVETLADRESAGVTELTEELGLSKSVVHNHLNTLLEHEYVVKEGTEYRLGLKLLGLGGQVRDRNPLYRHGRESVEYLAEETGEICNLMVEEHDHGIYLYRAVGERGVNTYWEEGGYTPLHATALGKAILAHYPEDRLDAYLAEAPLEESTARTTTDPAAIRSELETIRERGYALDDEERLEGMRCVGAAILVDGEPLGAISVSAPVRRMQDQRFRETIPGKLIDVADNVQIKIVTESRFG